jgi:hypothetical protein
MMYITYLALTMQRPDGSRIADYAGLENVIDIRFSISGGKLTADVSGRTRAAS